MNPEVLLGEALPVGSDAAESGSGMLDIMAKLNLSLGRVADCMDRDYQRRQRLIQAIHPLKTGPFQMTLNSGVGTMDLPDQLGPHTGFAWDIHLVVIFGFTAGTISMFSGATSGAALAAGTGDLEFTITQPGVFQYGKGQEMLMAPDRLSFFATGVTGNVFIKVRGLEMETSVVPDYLV